MIPVIFACLMVAAGVESNGNPPASSPETQSVYKKPKIQKSSAFNAVDRQRLTKQKKQNSMHELVSEHRGSFE